MDFKPLRLGVTFCDTRFLVAVSPLSTIADLKEEITRVFGLISAQSHSEDEAVFIQDGRGYLVSDDYQVGLVLDQVDTVFALTKSQPLDKYSGQWSALSCLATPQSSRLSIPASSNLSTAVQIGSPVVKSPLSHTSIGSTSKIRKETATAATRKDVDESDASETDCSTNLIPELLEGNLSAPLVVDSTKDKASSTQVKGGDITATTAAQTNDSTKKSDTLALVNPSKKKTTQIVYSDSSGLTSSDSDSDTAPATKKARSEGKPTKVSTEQPKATPKKKSTKKQTNTMSISEAAPSDKTRVSDSDEGKADKKSLQTFQLASDVIESQATTTKKVKAKRKLDKALSANPEKKLKKKYTSAISKKELELANTSTQSLILDNEELWTE